MLDLSSQDEGIPGRGIMEIKTDSTGTMITNITPTDREMIGLLVAVKRLRFAVAHTGVTDTAALFVVRRFAVSHGAREPHTMKQALKYMESLAK